MDLGEHAAVAPTEQPESKLPTKDEIVRWLADDFDLTATTIDPVVGGADPAASVWHITTKGGKEFAVKWTARRTRTGANLVESLDAAGKATSPTPVRSVEGRVRARRDGGRLTVSAWLGTDDAATTGLDLDQWEAYGRLLSDLHGHRFAAPERPLRGLRRGIRRRRRRYVAGVAELDELVENTRRDGFSGDPTLDVAAAWSGARPRIERLLAGTRLRGSRGEEKVPCHGDPHLGNVLIADDGSLRLIDWDEAVVGPREIDLHLIEFDVLFSPLTPEHREAFYRGYGEVTLDETRLVRFACVRALEDLVSTGLAAARAAGDQRRPAIRVFEGILSPVGSASLVEERLAAQLGS